MSKEIFEQIVSFVEKERWKYKIALTRETSLEKDLGITGDDADDFMGAFFKEFKIKQESFDISNYFGSEGFDPLGISTVILKLTGKARKRKILRDITLGELEKAVLAGRWVDGQ